MNALVTRKHQQSVISERMIKFYLDRHRAAEFQPHAAKVLKGFDLRKRRMREVLDWRKPITEEGRILCSHPIGYWVILAEQVP